jgi:hypothetical protein
MDTLLTTQTRTPHLPLRQLAPYALAAAGLLMLVLIMERVFPLGSDYFYHFRPLAEQWNEGYWHIYDGARERLLYPPWSLFVILPLGWFSLDMSKAVLLVTSIVAIVLALRLFYLSRRTPILMLVMALTHLHAFDMYIRGQFDSLVLLGVVLAWWAVAQRSPLWLSFALCLATVKPPAAIALALLLFLLAIRGWTRREQLQVLVYPALCLLVSFVAFGIDFPLDFISNLEAPLAYLSISLWRAADLFGIPSVVLVPPLIIAVGLWLRLAWREGVTLRVLAIALAVNFVFVPYANGNHYISLLPAFVYVASRNWKIAVLIYLLTWTPLLRAWLGYDAAILDIGYPIALLIACWRLPAPNSAPNSAAHLL